MNASTTGDGPTSHMRTTDSPASGIPSPLDGVARASPSPTALSGSRTKGDGIGCDTSTRESSLRVRNEAEGTGYSSRSSESSPVSFSEETGVWQLPRGSDR
jgi:hypothetical protein